MENSNFMEIRWQFSRKQRVVTEVEKHHKGEGDWKPREQRKRAISNKCQREVKGKEKNREKINTFPIRWSVETTWRAVGVQKAMALSGRQRSEKADIYEGWLGRDETLGVLLLKEQKLLADICGIKETLAVLEAERIELTQRKQQTMQERVETVFIAMAKSTARYNYVG